MSELEHRRRLKTESAAANVIRYWLTGEVYEDPPIQEQRRRHIPKGQLDRSAIPLSVHIPGASQLDRKAS